MESEALCIGCRRGERICPVCGEDLRVSEDGTWKCPDRDCGYVDRKVE